MLYMHAHAIHVGHASLESDEPTLRHDFFCVSRLYDIDSSRPLSCGGTHL